MTRGWVLNPRCNVAPGRLREPQAHPWVAQATLPETSERDWSRERGSVAWDGACGSRLSCSGRQVAAEQIWAAGRPFDLRRRWELFWAGSY